MAKEGRTETIQHALYALVACCVIKEMRKYATRLSNPCANRSMVGEGGIPLLIKVACSVSHAAVCSKDQVSGSGIPLSSLLTCTDSYLIYSASQRNVIEGGRKTGPYSCSISFA